MPASLTKITSNYQVTLPAAARKALGLKLGDVLEATVQRGAVVLRPKVVVVRDAFDPQLKRDIEAGLADVRAGRYLGPFDNADDARRAFEAFKKRKPRPNARRRQPTRR
jgi:AbrB family looped-hinge helix DNA binding protein